MRAPIFNRLKILSVRHHKGGTVVPASRAVIPCSGHERRRHAYTDNATASEATEYEGGEPMRRKTSDTMLSFGRVVLTIVLAVAFLLLLWNHWPT